MVPKVRSLVGKDDILQAKFSKKPALEVPNGFVKGRDHVLITYCDDRKREDVRELLRRELGVNEMFWKYERQTWKEMPQRGGKIPRDILDGLKELEEIE